MGRKSKYSSVSDEEILSAISASTTMAEAARKLEMDFRSFRNRAKSWKLMLLTKVKKA